MAALIEETYGKKRLIQVMCDQRLLFATFNEAAGAYNMRHVRQPLATWSDALVELK
jgi:hypothetical protein